MSALPEYIRHPLVPLRRAGPLVGSGAERREALPNAIARPRAGSEGWGDLDHDVILISAGSRSSDGAGRQRDDSMPNLRHASKHSANKAPQRRGPRTAAGKAPSGRISESGE